MNCKYHKELEAKYICEKCKQPICEECSHDIGGSRLCKACINEAVFNRVNKRFSGGFFENLWFLFLSIIPGASYMYMGLFKTGMQLMTGFIAAITLFSYVNLEGFIPLTIIPLWFYSFFGGYNTRRQIQAGEEVFDADIFDIGIIKRHKRLTGIIMIAFGIIGTINAFDFDLFNRMLRVNFNVFMAIKGSIFSISLILLGVYILLSPKQKKDQNANVEN